jgi:glycerophosphoryl diester phosphodiesterase
MHTLLIREESRSGHFEIPKGLHGNLRILSSDPYIVGLIESSNPESDFSFEIDCYKDGKAIGVCTFDINEMPSSKYVQVTLPVTASPDCASITMAICWVTPARTVISDPITVTYPSAFTIGHRGSGSNKVSHECLENTMKSFHLASSRGAEYIEFDIQLSADAVPVIFHDMIGFVTKERLLGMEPHEITKEGENRYVIKQFTEAEFRKTGFLTDYQTERPSFADLLKDLPSGLGFDVELKYPAPYKLNQRVPYFDINQFVEEILEVMIKYAGDRSIFFSSFDPFVCAMLRLKQSRWPVMQLFNCKKRWTGVDVMAARINSLAALHREMGVQGFVLDCTPLMQVPELIPNLKNQGFLVCTYGKLNNTADGIEKQLECGVSGICTDDVPLCHSVVDSWLKSK